MNIIVDIAQETIFSYAEVIVSEIDATEILKIDKLYSFDEASKINKFDKLFELINNNPVQIKTVVYQVNSNNVIFNIVTLENDLMTLSVNEKVTDYTSVDDNDIIKEISLLENFIFEEAKEATLNKYQYYKDENGLYSFRLDKYKTVKIQNMYLNFASKMNSNIYYNDYKFKDINLTKQILKDRTEREFIVFNTNSMNFEVVSLVESDYVNIDNIIANKLKTRYDLIVNKAKEILSCSTKEEVDLIDTSCKDCNN